MKAPEVLAWLERKGTKKNVAGLARYGIVAPRAFGVSMGDLQSFAKKLGKDHALALALWKTGWYEARLLATLIDDPGRVTARQMDAWARGFDNWGICDTACFVLFDRTPFAHDKARAWASSEHEFVRRAGFALMASLAGHDKTAHDAKFEAFLPLIERGAADDRNFVKKGVSWALRRIGNRSQAMHAAAVALAQRLAQSTAPAARWVGKDVVRDLNSAATRARVARARHG